MARHLPIRPCCSKPGFSATSTGLCEPAAGAAHHQLGLAQRHCQHHRRRYHLRRIEREQQREEDIMAFDLPALPYPKNALEPHTSAQTLDFHHGKHHQAYVTNLNNLVKDTPLASQSLEELIKGSYKDDSKIGIFNNAAQVWNHTFFWNCMKPGGGGAPSGNVASAIDRDL